jgi:hypothetical protein
MQGYQLLQEISDARSEQTSNEVKHSNVETCEFGLTISGYRPAYTLRVP